MEQRDDILYGCFSVYFKIRYLYDCCDLTFLKYTSNHLVSANQGMFSSRANIPSIFNRFLQMRCQNLSQRFFRFNKI